MGEKSVVDHRRLVTVAPDRMARSGGRVLNDSHLETPFEKLTQVRLNAYVSQHPAENDLIEPPFAQLQHQIVGLRPPNFVRADDDTYPYGYYGYYPPPAYYYPPAAYYPPARSCWSPYYHYYYVC